MRYLIIILALVLVACGSPAPIQVAPKPVIKQALPPVAQPVAITGGGGNQPTRSAR